MRSEKTKITLQIKSINNEEIFKVEIDSDSTVLQLTKKVAEKVLESKEQHSYGFVLIFHGNPINVKILKDKKITAIPVFSHAKKCVLQYEPLVISNKDTIYFVWRNQESDTYFSWDAMEEKSIEIETVQKLLKKILLVIDVVCAGSATITFALPFLTNLSVPIVWPIVFATLFVICAVLFLGFEKIFPKRWIEYPMLKTSFDMNNKSRYENQIGIEPNGRSIEKNYSEIGNV